MSTSFDQLNDIFLFRNARLSKFSLVPTGTHTALTSVDPTTGDLVGVDWALFSPDTNSVVSRLDATGYYERVFLGYRDEPQVMYVKSPYNPTSFSGSFEFQALAYSATGATGHNLTRTQELRLRDFSGNELSLVPIGEFDVAYTTAVLEFADFSASVVDGTVYMAMVCDVDIRFTIDGSTTPSYSSSTTGVGMWRSTNGVNYLPYSWASNWQSDHAGSGTLKITCFGLV